MAENLSNIAKILVNNPKFLKTIEGNIKFIMKDGKVDAYDIPEIMTIVTECYNNLGKIKVTYEELPNVLREIVDYIFGIINKQYEDHIVVNTNKLRKGEPMIIKSNPMKIYDKIGWRASLDIFDIVNKMYKFKKLAK